MSNPFSRTEILFGKDAMERLATARVAVFGVGGVGGYAAEALARSGIGAMDLIDSDIICESNINRQLHATWRTIGRYKVDVAAERIAEINPDVKICVHKVFYLPETADSFRFSEYDYIIDAIDTVTGKIALVMNAAASGTPIISSMGAGNKLDPTAFQVADIYSTSVCPLAKVMRRELRLPSRRWRRQRMTPQSLPPSPPLSQKKTTATSGFPAAIPSSRPWPG